MIEFNGYISGNAEKQFVKSEFLMLLTAFWFFPIGLLVLSIAYAINTGFWLIAQIFIGEHIFIPIAIVIVLSKRGRKKMLTKKVIIHDGLITAITDQQPVTQNISDVKQVNEYADYYKINFRFGRICNIFICQKDLITKGTLEEFDELFADKLVIKIS